MRNQPVLIMNERGHIFSPTKMGDVGHDLYVIIREQNSIERLVSRIIKKRCVIVWPGMTKAVGSGIRLGMNTTLWCQIVARSSTGRKRLMILGGIIDSGYQGELFAVLANFSFFPRIVREGERYAQAIFFAAHRPVVKEVKSFPITSERGATGFGSSGQ